MSAQEMAAGVVDFLFAAIVVSLTETLLSWRRRLLLLGRYAAQREQVPSPQVGYWAG